MVLHAIFTRRSLVSPPLSPSRPGTYADVAWIERGLFDASELYASTINTDDARLKARFEGGGEGLAPPRYNCTACPPGRFSNRSGVYYDSCQLCPNGTFSNDPNGAASCTPCQRGHFQVLDGAKSCDECPAGRYMNETGEGVECEPCQRGRSTNDKLGRPLCSECSDLNTPARERFLENSVTICEVGMSCGQKGGEYYFQPNKGRATCRECTSSGKKGSFGCNHKSGDIQVRMNELFCSIMLAHNPKPNIILFFSATDFTRQRRTAKSNSVSLKDWSLES